ncbi:MAG TPA: sigma-70 family RNA polymerase sigma factor [Bryobacteraceae bacterium]|nr:sigma-70 family RNA polymerase sigma factor [Bryobacteraceae bacterium]
MATSVARLEAQRRALTGHCYRMLGSVVDADDAVQETIIRAWRSLDRFDERASLRTWLYRIATNVCLDALADRTRRARPIEEGPAGMREDPFVQHPRTHWLEPIPDARAIPADTNPAERLLLSQSIRLAFVAALQYLPPKQRAVLLLIEVLGWSPAEVAETLDSSVAAVNSALQRARATLAERNLRDPEPLSEPQSHLLERYVDAFQRYDVDGLTSLLREDAAFSMPPYAMWFCGPGEVHDWLLGPGSGCRGSRLLPTAACGLPAFGQYRPNPEGGHKPWALIVLELAGDRIAAWTSFLDTETLFPRFDLPPALPALKFSAGTDDFGPGFRSNV